MSTPFDDDALQEGLGRTLRGIPPVRQILPGLAQALTQRATEAGPAQECLNVYSYGGIDGNPGGHIGFSKDGGRIYGKDPIPGEELASVFKSVPGYLAPVDPSRKPADQVRICAAPTRIDGAYRYLTDPGNAKTYQYETDNCSSYIPAGLRKAGLVAPQGLGVVVPGDLMDILHALYDVPQQHHLVDTRPQLPKY